MRIYGCEGAQQVLPQGDRGGGHSSRHGPRERGCGLDQHAEGGGRGRRPRGPLLRLQGPRPVWRLWSVSSFDFHPHRGKQAGRVPDPSSVRRRIPGALLCSLAQDYWREQGPVHGQLGAVTGSHC